jgi:hypothetical protein
MLDKKKLIYQMNLLNHFKKYSNSNLELFDMVPDLPTVYSDVNSSPDSSKCFNVDESASHEDMSDTDSLDDLINMNTNNNNNSRRSSECNSSSNVSNDLDDLTKPNQESLSQPNEIFNFDAIKWHINTVCLKMFTYFLIFIEFLQQYLEQLNQCARISIVRKYSLFFSIFNLGVYSKYIGIKKQLKLK